MLRGPQIDDGFEVQLGMKIIDEYGSTYCANLCSSGKTAENIFSEDK